MKDKIITVIMQMLLVFFIAAVCIAFTKSKTAIEKEIPVEKIVVKEVPVEVVKEVKKGNENLYPLCGTVVDVDYYDNTVVFQTANGNRFQFYGCEDWEEGGTAAAIMDNNGTETVYDDIIMMVRYCG